MSLFRRKRRTMPGLNTTSTADISFMLLIFFLVTTSMDVDKGLARLLPPAEKQTQEESEVPKEHLMTLKITASNELLLNDRPVAVKQVSREVEQFVERLGKEHLISIDADPASDYNAYFQLQNQLVMAYKNWRNKTAHRQFHCSYDELTAEQKEAVRTLCPQRIAENYNQ